MAKKLEKELAEIENILSGYEKNLINYFSNPAIYDKLFGELMPVMQDKLKSLKDNEYIDHLNVRFHIEPETEPGIQLRGPKLEFYINEGNQCYMGVSVTAVIHSTYLLSDYKFKDYDEYYEIYDNYLDDILEKNPGLSLMSSRKTTEINVIYDNDTEFVAEHVVPIILNTLTNFITSSNVKADIKRDSSTSFVIKFFK